MRYKLVRMLLLCAVSSILVAVLSGAAKPKYAIVIEDGAAQTTLYTSEEDPAAILRIAGVELGAHDAYHFSGIRDGRGDLRVERASLVTVKADGQAYPVYVAGGTVADALDKAGVRIGGEDRIDAALSQRVANEMTVTVTRVETRTLEREETVLRQVERIPTQTLKEGKTCMIEEGADGRRRVTVSQTLLDGRVAHEELLSEEVLAEPVTRRMLVGDHSVPTSRLTDTVELDSQGNPVNYVGKVTGKATAYSALGKPTKLVPGCVAMDLSLYPRGTRLYIKTPDSSYIYGYSEVRDTGPAVNEGIILVDLFFDSYEESCLFGAKTVDISILP